MHLAYVPQRDFNSKQSPTFEAETIVIRVTSKVRQAGRGRGGRRGPEPMCRSYSNVVSNRGRDFIP